VLVLVTAPSGVLENGGRAGSTKNTGGKLPPVFASSRHLEVPASMNRSDQNHTSGSSAISPQHDSTKAMAAARENATRRCWRTLSRECRKSVGVIGVTPLSGTRLRPAHRRAATLRFRVDHSSFRCSAWAGWHRRSIHDGPNSGAGIIKARIPQQTKNLKAAFIPALSTIPGASPPRRKQTRGPP
jgi:hypothetical protein